MKMQNLYYKPHIKLDVYNHIPYSTPAGRARKRYIFDILKQII